MQVVDNDQGRDNCGQLATVAQCQESHSSTAQNDDVRVVTHDGPIDVPLDNDALVDVPLNDDNAPVVDVPLDDVEQDTLEQESPCSAMVNHSGAPQQVIGGSQIDAKDKSSSSVPVSVHA